MLLGYLSIMPVTYLCVYKYTYIHIYKHNYIYIYYILNIYIHIHGVLSSFFFRQAWRVWFWDRVSPQFFPCTSNVLTFIWPSRNNDPHRRGSENFILHFSMDGEFETPLTDEGKKVNLQSKFEENCHSPRIQTKCHPLYPKRGFTKKKVFSSFAVWSDMTNCGMKLKASLI